MSDGESERESDQPTSDDSGASSVGYPRSLKRCSGFCCCVASCCCVVFPFLVGGMVVALVTGGGRRRRLIDISTEMPELLRSLNRSVDPCQDFYSFVCDGWRRLATNPVSRVEEIVQVAHRNVMSLLRQVRVPAVGPVNGATQKAALLFQKCLLLPLRPPSPEVLLQFVASLGLDWPRAPAMGMQDLISLMVHLSLSWDISAVFKLDLLPTPKKAGDRPRWRLSPSPDLESWREGRRNLGIMYLISIREHVESFSSVKVTRRLLDDVFEADDEVLRITNVYKSGGETMAIADFKKAAPGFQTAMWLEAINQQTRGYLEVLEADLVEVSNVRFLVALRRLFGELNARNPPAIPLYLTWHLLRTLAWTVVPHEVTSEGDLEEWCFRAVHAQIPLAAGKPLFDSVSSERGTVEELFEAIKSEYQGRIARSAWMDDATRRSADHKIRSVRGVFFAPAIIQNETALGIIYGCVPESREAPFLTSLLAARRCSWMHVLSIAASGNTSPETITWTSPAANVMRYLDAYNSAVVMGSLLRPPVLQVSGAHPDVFNYAGLGFILGGLLFNAIDAKGSLRDADGVLQPWWSNSSREQFSSAVQCLEELFQLDSRFIREEIGETVATCVAFSAYERHVEEVEAARSGLWDRLAAWLTWPVWLIGRTEYEFADDQVFFLNRCFCFCSRVQSLLDTAEWTSPAQRCNLPLKNSPEFWRAFGCRRGDQMRAETSCQLI